MKVGTDSVILGAWTTIAGSETILDVGTGTGLLALMLAQRSIALIDAVEIDPDAAIQAKENVSISPWKSRINVVNSSFQDFCVTTSARYDLIVCNPPFFSHSLKAKNESRTLARHNDSLSFRELISGSERILKPIGRLSVIIPNEDEENFIKLAEEHLLYPHKKLKIRPLPGKDYKRVILEFGYGKKECLTQEICIETGERHKYSSEYIDLTKDFYL